MTLAKSKKNELKTNVLKDIIDKQRFAYDTLERYSGSSVSEFCSNLILTNFPNYVKHLAGLYHVEIFEGAMFKVAHIKEEDITILDFKIGSTAAALIIDLCSHLPFNNILFLGMCAGLKKHHKVGDYFIPMASVRDEGTSNRYYPSEIPAVPDFSLQKLVMECLDDAKLIYHLGVAHTANIRFWEFDEAFKERLKAGNADVYELECATIFSAASKYKLKLGALLLVSDIPLNKKGVKTKEHAEWVYKNLMPKHIDQGIKILKKSIDFKLTEV